MRKNFGPQTWMFPMPVLVIGTYDSNHKSNAMTAAWGGIYDTNQIFICLSSNHKTTDNIKLKRQFSVSFGTKDTAVISDYIGLVTGNEVDKISKAHLVDKQCKNIDAPYFEEFPMTLECEVYKLDDDGQTAYLVGNIINISADEKILNSNGGIDSTLLNPIVFDATDSSYKIVGEKICDAFKAGFKLK